MISDAQCVIDYRALEIEKKRNLDTVRFVLQFHRGQKLIEKDWTCLSESRVPSDTGVLVLPEVAD